MKIPAYTPLQVSDSESVPRSFSSVELSGDVTLKLPGQWFLPKRNLPREQVVAELESLGRSFLKGVYAVSGVYLRIIQHIRDYDLDGKEVTGALSKAGFCVSKISEMRRLAAAPDQIFREYAGGQIGFRVALEKTRSYHQGQRGKPQWKNRQLRRAASRLISLAKLEAMTGGEWEYQLKGYKVKVLPL